LHATRRPRVPSFAREKCDEGRISWYYNGVVRGAMMHGGLVIAGVAGLVGLASEVAHAASADAVP